MGVNIIIVNTIYLNDALALNGISASGCYLGFYFCLCIFFQLIEQYYARNDLSVWVFPSDRSTPFGFSNMIIFSLLAESVKPFSMPTIIRPNRSAGSKGIPPPPPSSGSSTHLKALEKVNAIRPASPSGYYDFSGGVANNVGSSSHLADLLDLDCNEEWWVFIDTFDSWSISSLTAFLLGRTRTRIIRRQSRAFHLLRHQQQQLRLLFY